jgi:hypothetical protein
MMHYGTLRNLHQLELTDHTLTFLSILLRGRLFKWVTVEFCECLPCPNSQKLNSKLATDPHVVTTMSLHQHSWYVIHLKIPIGDGVATTAQN